MDILGLERNCSKRTVSNGDFIVTELVTNVLSKVTPGWVECCYLGL